MVRPGRRVRARRAPARPRNAADAGPSDQDRRDRTRSVAGADARRLVYASVAGGVIPRGDPRARWRSPTIRTRKPTRPTNPSAPARISPQVRPADQETRPLAR